MAFSVAMAVGNWITLIKRPPGEKIATVIFVMGGVAGFFGALFHTTLAWQWGFAFLAFDPGCFLMVGGIPLLFRWMVERKLFNKS